MKKCKLFSCWTDYPIEALGDKPGKTAPYRQATIYSYDGNKYALVQVEGVFLEIKTGYLYSSPDKLSYQYKMWWNKFVNRRKFEMMINTPIPSDSILSY
jgi:hypothetical protein